MNTLQDLRSLVCAEKRSLRAALSSAPVASSVISRPRFQLFNASRIAIETNGVVFLAKLHRQRQPNIRETNNGDPLSAQATHCNSVLKRGV
jgi:hypothetical protein